MAVRHVRDAAAAASNGQGRTARTIAPGQPRRKRRTCISKRSTRRGRSRIRRAESVPVQAEAAAAAAAGAAGDAAGRYGAGADGPPPPPPPITLKFIGIVDAGQSQKMAILSDGRGSPFTAAKGRRCSANTASCGLVTESIEMSYLDGRGRQTIRFTGS